MKNDPAIIAVWDKLPDPSAGASNANDASIVVPERFWRKFVGKHVRDPSEPWADVFGDAIVKSLQATPVGPFHEGPAAEPTRRALAVLEKEVRASLNQPLVLTYTSLGEHGINAQRWIVPLPAGAIAVVYAEATRKNIVTCYFTGAAGVVPLGMQDAAFRRRRWKTVLRTLVSEFADSDQTGRLRLPVGRHRREKDGPPPEMCINIRFVTPRMWGFASDTPGSEWTMPTWDWPGADETA